MEPRRPQEAQTEPGGAREAQIEPQEAHISPRRPLEAQNEPQGAHGPCWRLLRRRRPSLPPTMSTSHQPTVYASCTPSPCSCRWRAVALSGTSPWRS